MTTLDFTYETHGEHYTVYPALGQPDQRWLAPQGLVLARRADGLADLHLSLVRAMTPQPRTYGLLDLRVEADYALAEAQADLGATAPLSTLRPAVPSGGHLRLALEELVISQPLTWNGLSQSRLRLPLDATAAAVVHQALVQGTLVAQATVVFALAGYAARSAATVTFDPAQLLAALHTARDATGFYAYPALQNWLAQAWAQLPLHWQPATSTGFVPDVERQRAALLDRLVARFATLVPPPTDEALPYLDLPATVPSGAITWRLDDETVTWRPLVLQWQPLVVVREQIATHGLAPFFSQSETPPLPSGHVDIAIIGNLPANRVNVLSIGAHLTAPPRPPLRPQAVQGSASLTPPADSSTVRLRLGVREALSYTIQPLVVIATDADFLSLAGSPRPGTSTTVELSPADYPVTFYEISGEPALLTLARLTGALHWQAEGHAYQTPVSLDEQQPTINLAVPQGATRPMLQLTATAYSDGQTLPVLPPPVSDGYITRWHLPGFGAQTIRFTAAVAPPAPILLEVQPADAAAPPAGTRLILRADQPTVTWGYVVLNPFCAGFRYRLLPDGAWSPRHSPLEQTEIIV